MIKTNYDVTLQINDKEFFVVVNEPNIEQREELDDFVNKNSSRYEKRDNLKLDLNEYQEEFYINKQILEHGKISEKASVWVDQKMLNKKIFKLKKEIRDIDNNIESVEKSLESIYRKRFELLVSGVDKVKLQKEVDSKGIRYKTIFIAIAEQVKKEKEKK